jgi:uracil-DNA glycosylase family 4
MSSPTDFDAHAAFDAELRACQRCAALLSRETVDGEPASERVKPAPIVTGIRKRPVILIGQAPGITEYRTGRPFAGDAGQGIREVFADAGIDAARFPETVYTCAVVKCFPGRERVKSRRGGFRTQDKAPSRQMIRNCADLLRRQIDLCDPALIVTLGSVALRAMLGDDARLEDFVGKATPCGGRKLIAMPHTSGSSFWLNDAGNRSLFAAARQVLAREIGSFVGDPRH